MIKTELRYNPFLLETEIKFNGIYPRVNSQVEKYMGKPLQDWVDKIPDIFHDEMNGYDFGLDFTGIPDDFEMLKKAFANAGVGEEQVHLFFKNELEQANTKSERVDSLLKWLKNNSNGRFDEKKFRDDNSELFDAPYPMIIINGSRTKTDELKDYDVLIENVDDCLELMNTNLENTPVIIVVNQLDSSFLNKTISFLMGRKKVTSKQLFFYINPALNPGQIKRIIIDLGVKKPQIINSVRDDKILHYITEYAITDYVRKAIVVFRKSIAPVENILNEENEKSNAINSAIHKKVQELDDRIKSLKLADEKYVQKDNLDRPSSFDELIPEFEEKVLGWRSFKTKVTKEEEADELIRELENKARNFFKEFLTHLDECIYEHRKLIEIILESIYEDSDASDAFSYTAKLESYNNSVYVPSLYEELMNMREERYVDVKESFWKGFFGEESPKDKEQVLTYTFYCSNWRNRINEEYTKKMKDVIEDSLTKLNKYYDEAAMELHNHLLTIIDDDSKKKEKEMSKLSESERLLQIDNDWLSNFEDQLLTIERA